MCGDGTCSPGAGESCSACPADCGSCAACGNGSCETGIGESCTSCPADCGGCVGCGNGTCDAGEDCGSCPGDCGACTTTCGPANCAGCCDGDACLSGTSPTGCGSGGNVCMVCGPGFVCSGAGSCAVDPASRWSVVLGTLTVEPTRYDGEAWDAFGGAPDPFVGVVIGSDTATPLYSGAGSDTFTVSFTADPVATNVRADALQAYLAFDVFDEDVSAHDVVGACVTNVTEAAFAGTLQTMNCPRNPSRMQSGFTLTWRLVRY